MAELYSQYISGLQLDPGVIVGSSTGESGLNDITQRINSISSADNLIDAVTISGTDTIIYAGSIIMSGCLVIEQRTTEPGDVIEGRIWIEI